MEVEDDVQLAHVSIVLVHLLDVAVDNLEGDELVVVGIAAGDKKEGGVSAIDYLRIWLEVWSVSGVHSRASEATRTFVLQEIAHPCPASQHELRHIFDDFRLLFGRQCGEPLCQPLQQV